MQSSVHHEILMALSGYPGNIFRVSKDDGIIEVDSILPFVHPSEAAQLNRLCRLGTQYNQLKKFISSQNSAAFSLPKPTSTAQASKRSGLYLKSLACGIDKVLHGYRQELVRLEQKCVNEPHLPLSHLQAELEQYHLLLPALTKCVSEVTSSSSNCHGCQILSYLHDQCNSGVPSIQEAFQQILCMCHGVLYKQLSAWMLHGLLQEDREEFFIGQQEKKKQVEFLSGQDEAEEEEEEEGGGGETVRGSSDVAGETEMDLEYVILHRMAPSYLPMRILEKILFVGKAVKVFKDTERQQSTSKDHYGSLLVTTADSRLRSDQIRFADMLAQLQRQSKFCLQDLDKVVDAIRDCVAELLWKLLVEESNLTSHLQVMKDFYLLGRGEMYLAFIDLAHHFMAAPPTANTQHDVNLAFHQAISRVGLDSEKMSKQFELAVPYTKKRDRERVRDRDKERKKTKEVKESVGVSAWEHLSLSHSCQWPLHTLITPPILNKYNTLFQVLLRLRRAQVSLHQCWALLMQHYRRDTSLWQVWELRTHMSFLIDNLQYYVQVDVLEVQFSHLLQQINETHDFECIFHAHETFLTTLQSQLFLTQPAVHHCLLELLALCQSLCRVLESSQDLCFSVKETAEISRIGKDFTRQSSLFFDIITRVKVHGSAPHLAQLLLRVDYNKYYSTIRQSKFGLTTPTV